MWRQNLLEKIENKTAKLGVIGLGYVGLPLAVEKAKTGFTVVGFDVQKNKVDNVNAGINYIGDILDGDLSRMVNEKRLSATGDFCFVKDMDCVAICVPTPLNKHFQPDISYVVSSCESVAQHLKPGALVVLESTTYPGTTREVVRPIFEKNGFICERDFFLAFSPERVDPGNKLYNTKNTPKVVGGMGPASAEVAAALYRAILECDVFVASSPEIAEMEKILENTFRNLNIALANEMAMLCHKMGIDIWEVIEAAKTKPYGFMPFYPGPGVGGHCIPIDPFYLSWKAREFNFHLKLIEDSNDINTNMPEYIVERAMKILNRFGKALNGSKIIVLGVAYKQDVADYRESPALDVITNLDKYGADVSYNDPYIPVLPLRGKEYNSVELTPAVLGTFDLAIITTMHAVYDYGFIADNAAYVFDTKNAMKNIECANYEKL